MKINKKIEFSFKKEDFDLKKINDFILNNSGLVFMVFFILITGMGSFLIYEYIYKSVWSEAEKNAYLQEMKKDNLDFRINVFNDVITEIEARKVRYQHDKEVSVNDIFGISK